MPIDWMLKIFDRCWMQAGMTSINDFATTYMCQSLPFGGVKESGFDRFAGIEGLRGLTMPKAVAEDRRPLLSCVLFPCPAPAVLLRSTGLSQSQAG